ncbi:vesicle-associated membrane protein 712-like isoform X2 [Peromyscus leucopus]|uniref:vesicle-associated membrane protein 712-like isoform X2 n=1 Tax=Peromyscus leucopus TaxID=10041 RepID=UPI0010A1E0C2|nr:vesicle-associated membrane protein 712-like isoform X2 [Peromyscus leucopus]
MTITYSCVAHGRAVLAELALTGGSYQEAAAKVLRQVLLKAEPATIIQIGSYVYHTLFIDGITYLCATDNGLDSMAPSAFLKKVSDIFTRNPLMSQEHFFPSNALATDFQRILAQHMMEYNKSQRDNNTVFTVKSQVTDVKNIMLRNIDTVLEREIETASIITEGAEDPQATAEEFEKTRKIPKRICWKCFKIVITTLTILLSIIIILLRTHIIPT